MATQLRHIAVHVTEPAAGDFCWVLTELAADHSWSIVRSAKKRADTYRQAMADGLLQLQTMVDDLDEGPRSETGAKGGEPSRPAGAKPAGRERVPAPDEIADEENPLNARPSVFGFGLAN